MKTNGFRAPTRSGKSVFAVSIIVALILASLSAMSVFAAPPNPSNPTGNILSNTWGNQWRDLQFAQAWYSNYRSQPGQNSKSQDPKIQQYLGQYAFALRQAGAIIKGSVNANGQGSNSGTQSNNSNGQSNNQGGNNLSAQQQLAFCLHMMRGLRDKIISTGGSSIARNNNSDNAVANAGIPITGGSSSSTGSSSSSSSSSSSATGSAGVPVTGGQASTSTLNNTSMSNVWGSQWHDLVFAQSWYNNYRSQPGKNQSALDPKIQQWLERYAFALRQAGAIVRSGVNANGQANNSTSSTSSQSSSSSSSTSGQSNNSNGQSFNQGGNSQSTQQQLAFWLHMMRGLRDKILTGDTNNSNVQ